MKSLIAQISEFLDQCCATSGIEYHHVPTNIFMSQKYANEIIKEAMVSTKYDGTATKEAKLQTIQSPYGNLSVFIKKTDFGWANEEEDTIDITFSDNTMKRFIPFSDQLFKELESQSSDAEMFQEELKRL